MAAVAPGGITAATTGLKFTPTSLDASHLLPTFALAFVLKVSLLRGRHESGKFQD